jgi:hypothetical protein
MPGRAFIPGPLAQAQPRVYKSIRGRQLRGLLLAATGAGLGLVIFGAGDVTGYGATFLMAVPGFAYGYFQPEGKPVEYWFLVILRYHFTSQRLGAGRGGSAAQRLYLKARWALGIARRARRMGKHKEVLTIGGR